MAQRWPLLALVFNSAAERRRLMNSLPTSYKAFMHGNVSEPDGDDDDDDDSETEDYFDWSKPIGGSNTDSLMDRLLDAGAERLCDLMPADTVCCTLGVDVLRCEPVGVTRLTDRRGGERRYVKFSCLSAHAPSVDTPALFNSPNLLVPVRQARLSDRERDVWLAASDDPSNWWHTEVVLRASTVAGDWLLSLYVEASYLLLSVMKHYVWTNGAADTLGGAVRYAAAFDETRSDLGYLVLDYLYFVLQEKPRHADETRRRVDELLKCLEMRVKRRKRKRSQ